MKKAVLYLNQFFGRAGGEDMADLRPRLCEGGAGVAMQFAKALDAQITYTIICGDNFMESNTDEAVAAILDMLKDKEMDIFLAGPAFNAGSYGVACGTVCKAVKEKLGIPAVTSMSAENPGAEMFKKDVYILNGWNIASKIREDISAMVNAANKILKGMPAGRREMDKVYDVIILGAGPAGLSAGLYAGRSRLSTLIIEKGNDGGQIAITDEIENYPGQNIEGESGPSLIERMTGQCEKFGVVRVSDTVIDMDLGSAVKTLKGTKGEYKAKTLIIATGAFARPIGCKGEREFLGKGVSYCATCDANFFEDFEVFVVGGGDSAVEEAMYLTKFARKVTLIHRRDELRAAKSIQEKAFKNDKLFFMWDTVVEEVSGEGLLSSMTVKNVKTGELTKIDADEEDGMFGVFGFIGTLPCTDVFKGKGIELDERGYIPTDPDMHTNIAGVFAAGDVRAKSLRQVVTAAADGAIAATQAEKYINEME